MQKLFYIFAIVVVLGFIFIVSVSAQTLQTLAEIETLADSGKTEKGSYTQQKVNEVQEIWVYETPSGSFGYQVVKRSVTGRIIESVGYGVLASSRTYKIDEKDL